MLSTSSHEIYAWTIVNDMRSNPSAFADELEGLYRDTISRAHGVSSNDPIWTDLRNIIDDRNTSNFWAALDLLRSQPRLGPLGWEENLEKVSGDHNAWMQTHAYAHSYVDGSDDFPIVFGEMPGFSQPGINGDYDVVNQEILGHFSDGTWAENISFSSGASFPATRAQYSVGSRAFRQRQAYADIIMFITEVRSDSLGHLRNLLSRDRISDGFGLAGGKNKSIGRKDAIGIDFNNFDDGFTNGDTNFVSTHTLTGHSPSAGGYISGVAYEDLNHNGHYDSAEGINVSLEWDSLDGPFGGGSSTSGETHGIINEWFSNGAYRFTFTAGSRVIGRRTVNIDNGNVWVEFIASDGFGLVGDPTASLVADLYESDGGNNSRAKATNLGRLSPSDLIGARTESLSIHTGTDEDWFRFEVADGVARADILAGFKDSDGDIDMRLYRVNDNNSLDNVAHSLSTTDDESITRTLQPGIYYLSVFGHLDNTNFYSLSIDVTVDPYPTMTTGPDAGGGPHVRTFDARTGAERTGFFAFAPSFTGGVRLATTYSNGDNIPDIVAAAGPGGGPHVRQFDGENGQPLGGPLGSFFAYSPAFTGGVFVAGGDFDGDGQGDIVTAPGAGGGPHIRVFRGADGSLIREFFAYAPNFAGGVHVAVGDVNGDGTPDIVTAPGAGGGPHVRVFDGQTGQQLSGAIGSFFAYDGAFAGGVYVAVADVDGDGRGDIITGTGAGGGPHVKVFSGANGSVIHSFFAYGAGFTGGVRVAAADADSNGRADIVVSPGRGGGPHVRIFSGTNTAVLHEMFAYAPNFVGGVWLGASPGNLGGQALRAATVQEGDAVAELSQEELNLGVAMVTDLWQAGLANGGMGETLRNIELLVADLPGDTLGLAYPDRILIDADAAGNGWFVDRSADTSDDVPAARMDLLSVIAHELAHVLGYGDTAHDDELMSDRLPTGSRRSLSLSVRDAVLADFDD